MFAKTLHFQIIIFPTLVMKVLVIIFSHMYGLPLFISQLVCLLWCSFFTAEREAPVDGCFAVLRNIEIFYP